MFSRSSYPPLARFVAIAILSASLLTSKSLAQFETRTSVQVANIPWSVVVGDFNHDGKQDLAIADCKFLWIYVGNGNGTFQRPMRNTVGVCPRSVVSGDLNHDGTLDLVVADGDGGRLYLMTGKGDGTFSISPFALASFPQFVGLADVNGDNELDLVVLASDLTPISVYLNQGNGVFARQPIETEVTGFASGVAWGDFNHDGKLDLAVTEYLGFANDVTVLLGDGNGRFHSGPSYTVDPHPLWVAAADLRGSGKVDLAVASDQGGVSVLLGNGDGTFQAPVSYPVSFPNWIVTADVNGDGKPDMVVGANSINDSPASGGVSVLLGNGDGTFQLAQTYVDGIFTYTLAVGDMNGDQKADLLLGSIGSKFQVDELINTGVAHFFPTTPLAFPAQFVGTTSTPLVTTITNSGATALKIYSVTLQGPMFSMKTNCKGNLAPSAKCSVQARFTPQTEGPASGTVTIKDSASSKPQVIELLGAGTVVKLSPPQLNFPPQKVGTKSQPLQFQIVNTGSVPITVITITISGKNFNDFFWTYPCVGGQIAPGGECTVTVTFTPKNPGFRVAEISVSDDGGGSFQTEIVTGTGT